MAEQSNIIGLVPQAKPDFEPSQALIDWLEERLEEARSGKLQGMAGACQFERDATYFVMGWAGGFQTLGALQMACYAQAGVVD